MIKGISDARRSVFATSQWFDDQSNRILEAVGRIEIMDGVNENIELNSTLTDMRILAYLASYHSWRMKAAVYYNVFLQTQDLWSFDTALDFENRAIEAWEHIVQSAGDVYTGDLMMGICSMNMCGHWKDDLLQLKASYKTLEGERASFKPEIAENQMLIVHLPHRKIEPADTTMLKACVFSKGATLRVWASVRQSDGTYSDFEMYEKSKGQFQVLIPLPSGRDRFYYYIKAIDTTGVEQKWPALQRAVKLVEITGDDTPPVIELDRIHSAFAGNPLRISADVKDSSDIEWVRLRYRHLTQMEDYQTLEMVQDIAAGRWEASIPKEFITPEWDLIYFIEAMDKHGNGRMAPDLEHEMPYVVVELER